MKKAIILVCGCVVHIDTITRVCDEHRSDDHSQSIIENLKKRVAFFENAFEKLSKIEDIIKDIREDL